MSNNSSNSSNWAYAFDREAWNVSRYILYSAYIAIGGTANLWLLLALLTCRKMRAVLKIRVVCSLLLIQLSDAWILFPVYLGINRRQYSCVVAAVITHLSWIQDFIANWVLVLMLVLFLIKIINFWPQIFDGILSYLLPISPWIVSLIMIPVIARAHRSSEDLPCVYEPYFKSFLIFGTLSTAIPLSLCLILLLVTALLRCRQLSGTRGLPGAATVEMLSKGPEVDAWYPYAIIVGVACALDLPMLLVKFGVGKGTPGRIAFYLTGRTLMNCRLIFMPFAILAIPEIRERVRTWRPFCYNPGPGIDVTVRYRHTE